MQSAAHRDYWDQIIEGKEIYGEHLEYEEQIGFSIIYRSPKLLTMLSRGGRLEQVVDLIKKGYRTRMVREKTGVDRHTICKARKIVESQLGRPILCECGRLITHGGACFSMWREGCRQKYLAEETRSRLIEYLHQGMSHREIAGRLGCGKRTVNRYSVKLKNNLPLQKRSAL